MENSDYRISICVASDMNKTERIKILSNQKCETLYLLSYSGFLLDNSLRGRGVLY